MSLETELANAQPERIEIQGVTKSYTTQRGTVVALDNVSLKVGEGEFLCLVGPSGCGKSTLLNIIAGLDTPDSGRVLANGESVTGPGRDRMVMFQEHALFPWLDVLGNVMFGLRLKPGLNNKERKEVAKYYLDLVGLSKFQHANIHELSGGMRLPATLQSACGFVAILVIAWLASEDRRTLAWRTVLAGIALQLVLAAALLKLDVFKQFFFALNETLLALEKATQAGTSFVFGYLAGGALPYAETGPGSSFVRLPATMYGSSCSSRPMPCPVRWKNRSPSPPATITSRAAASTASQLTPGLAAAVAAAAVLVVVMRNVFVAVDCQLLITPPTSTIACVVAVVARSCCMPTPLTCTPARFGFASSAAVPVPGT